jgi:hypothetical protein
MEALEEVVEEDPLMDVGDLKEEESPAKYAGKIITLLLTIIRGMTMKTMLQLNLP